MKNKHNLTPVQIVRNRQFVAALRANKKKAFNQMRDEETGGRCCLCVAYDVAKASGAKLTKLAQYAVMPPEAMANWYGWPSIDPELGRVRDVASVYNDGNGEPGSARSHKKIAALFTTEFLK